jgi:hypothetical protein
MPFRTPAFASLILLVTLASPAFAACYHKDGDAAETITETEGSGLLWRHRGRSVLFETGSGGTGIDYRIAYDPEGNGFRYEYVGDLLIFGGVRYIKGCE